MGTAIFFVHYCICTNINTTIGQGFSLPPYTEVPLIIMLPTHSHTQKSGDKVKQEVVIKTEERK